MKKLGELILICTVVFWGVAHGQASRTQGAQANVRDTIMVIGDGEVVAKPDQATISLTIAASDADASKAKAEADRKYQAVVAAAKQQGLLASAIKLSTLQLFPEYDWRDNRQFFKGIRVSRALTITVNELDMVAPLVQAFAENDVSTINSVQTGIKDRSGFERAALEAATRNAKEKARFLAKQFGKTLGSAHTISEYNDIPQFQPMADTMRSMAESSSVPEEHFGEQRVKSRVAVVFHAY